MHRSALIAGGAFFNAYCKQEAGTIVDIGALDINGSLRSVAPAHYKYVGLDVSPGKGVDIALADPYSFPLGTSSVEVVVSTSCFEHDNFFWLTFLEALRILKDEGIFYLNAPSNGLYHRHPMDNWRFYPDSGKALEAWGRKNGFDVQLLESFVLNQMSELEDDFWNDFIAIFRKGGTERPDRFIHTAFTAATNVWAYGNADVMNPEHLPEDRRQVKILARQLRQVTDAPPEIS